MNSIEKRVALVTGANRGIGKAIVEAFLAAGAAKVYAAARNPASLQPLVDADPERVVPLHLDLTDPQSIAAAAERAGDAEIVVNNAGVLLATDLLSAEAFDAFAKELDVNVHGLLRMAQAFAPVLGANGGGALVQINSVASLKNFAPLATYSASKAASYSITQALRDVLAPQGTQVVSVHPGPIATDMAANAGMMDMAEPASRVPEAIITALDEEAFHAYPDTMARQFGAAYASFARDVIEAEVSEG